MKQPSRGTHGAAVQTQPLGTRDDTQLSWLKLGAQGKLGCVSKVSHKNHSMDCSSDCSLLQLELKP